jgi:acyl carrier protein
VSAVACDVTDRRALADLVSAHDDELTAVIHLAAALDDAVLDGLTPAQVERAWRAKAGAAWDLHELTRQLPLSAFVLFSSVAATVGGSGQGAYVAANAFLDGLAAYRRGLGLPATSVAWGAWDGDGLSAGAVGRVSRRNGVLPMDPGLAVSVLGAAVAEDRPIAVVADVAWARSFLARGQAAGDPLLSELPELRVPESGSLEPDGDRLAERLAGLPVAEQQELLRRVVTDRVAAVLGLATPAQLDVSRPVKELGFDSVASVELRNLLNQATGLVLPASLVFDHPTAEALVTYLHSCLTGASDTTAAPALREISRLEQTLGKTEATGVERTAIAARLRALLDDWARGDSTRPDLEDATDDEMFDMLGNEFGIS